MPQCPLCRSEIADDFGLAECGNCGAQLIIHVDGRVEHNSTIAVSDSSASDSSGVRQVPDRTPEGATQVVTLEAADEFADELIFEDPPMDADAAPAGEEHPEVHAVADFAEEERASLQPSQSPPLAEPQLEELPPGESPSEDPPRQELSSSDLSDLARFGNSDSSLGREGPLRYDVWISGIDTADVRTAFREAITDRKFMWDTDAILRTIRNGEVRIKSVSAAKAHVLIVRLRSLPVSVRWEQYGVAQV